MGEWNYHYQFHNGTIQARIWGWITFHIYHLSKHLNYILLIGWKWNQVFFLSPLQHHLHKSPSWPVPLYYFNQPCFLSGLMAVTSLHNSFKYISMKFFNSCLLVFLCKSLPWPPHLPTPTGALLYLAVAIMAFSQTHQVQGLLPIYPRTFSHAHLSPRTFPTCLPQLLAE